MVRISNSFFNFINFCVTVSFFFTKLLTLGILFSTVLRAVVVAKLVILDISPLTSFVLALRLVLVAKLVISGTFILALYTSFLTKFFTTSTGTGTNLSTSNLSTLLFIKLLKLLGSFFNLSTSDFKLAKSTF